MSGLTAVILAAGEGKRMRSRRPKALHPLCGCPLIGYPVRLARALADRIVVVIGPDAEAVSTYLGTAIAPGEGPQPFTVVQQERLGTGHAMLQAREACPDDGVILVLPGDMPLLSTETLERLL